MSGASTGVPRRSKGVEQELAWRRQGDTDPKSVGRRFMWWTTCGEVRDDDDEEDGSPGKGVPRCTE